MINAVNSRRESLSGTQFNGSSDPSHGSPIFCFSAEAASKLEDLNNDRGWPRLCFRIGALADLRSGL